MKVNGSVMIPTARERKVLQNIRYGDTHYPGDLLGAGEQTRREMVDKGWIEFFPHPVSGGPRVRITAAGKAALDAPIPPKVRARPKLTMLKPRIATMDTRTVKPWRK